LDNYLEPICPSIPFWNIYDYTYFKIIINFLLRDSDPYTTKILETILKVPNLNNFKIGVIAMECLTGFLTLSDYQRRNPSRINITNSMARFEIARLYKLGFIHGDLNKGNVLIHPNYKYFDGIDGRVILIDFGATFRPSELPNIDDEHLYEASKQSLLIDSPV
jgi:tRNA A-37 threonylcarbamoyl transferase component Bud32